MHYHIRKTFYFEKFLKQGLDVVHLEMSSGISGSFNSAQIAKRELNQKYKDRGLVIIGFPCNQFGQQDPGSDNEILDFCQINYGVTFQMMKKIEVNGDNASPIYTFLKEKTKNILGEDIKWNFTKFLISADGKKIKRYAPTVKPSRLEKDIEEMIKDAKSKVRTEELVDHSV